MSIEKEFEEAWKLYPRKEGKINALRHFRKLKPLERKQVVDAIRNYVRVIKVEQRAHRHVMIGSTFFLTRWADYLDYEPIAPPEPESNRPKTLAEQFLGKQEVQDEKQRLH